VLSTPATVVCALARAAQHGVLIKGGAALEALRRVSYPALLDCACIALLPGDALHLSTCCVL